MHGDAGMVDIGGRALYSQVRGRGPAVVLNGSAGRAGVGAWPTIEPHVSEFATVVTYDRAGLGQSPAPANPPTVRDMMVDLHDLLIALQIPTPVVLVGTSLSALTAQLYACEYPREVSGLLLLDPTPDDSLAGLLNNPPAVQDAMRAAMLSNAQKLGMSDAGLLEMQKLAESCVQVHRAVAEEKKMPDIEFVVITASIPPTIEGKSSGGNYLAHAHKRIVERAPRGQHLFAQRSSHRTLTSEQPDLVIDTIRMILERSAAHEPRL